MPNAMASLSTVSTWTKLVATCAAANVRQFDALMIDARRRRFGCVLAYRHTAVQQHERGDRGG